MANFIPSEHAQRAAAFDRVVLSSNHLLNHPTVANGLGSDATEQLKTGVAGAFLPDISHGVVVLPWSQENTDNIAVIPQIDADEAGPGLSLTPGMLKPSARRIQMLHDARADREENIAATRARYAHTGASFTNDLPTTIEPVQGFHGRTGLFMDDTHPDRTLPIITARPHIILSTKILDAPSPVRGAALIHERGHADHIEALLKAPEDMDAWRVRSELEMIRITELCLTAAGVETDPYVMSEYKLDRILQIELRRRELNATGDPYDPKRAFIDMILPGQSKGNPVVIPTGQQPK